MLILVIICPKNNGAYVIHLDKYGNIGSHPIALYVLKNDVTYFDSFGIEHIPEEIKKIISNKNITKIVLEYKHAIQ